MIPSPFEVLKLCHDAGKEKKLRDELHKLGFSNRDIKEKINRYWKDKKVFKSLSIEDYIK